MSLSAARSIIGKFRQRAQVLGVSWPDPVRNPTASEFEVDLWTLRASYWKKSCR